MGRIVRYITEDGSAYIIACDSGDVISEAQKIHKSSPVVTAAFGRLLTATAIMGATLKGKNDSITVRINGSGPTGSLIAVSDSSSNVRGYVQNNFVNIPLNSNGKLDVASAVGKDGTISVFKDLGLKEPFSGVVPLYSGEIAEDITEYYVMSEQIPSMCALGVSIDENSVIKCAGGFLIQLLPGCSEITIDKIEASVSSLDTVTQLLSKGNDIDYIANKALSGLNITKTDEKTFEYKCYCSRDKVKSALVSTGKDALEDMADSDENTVVNCHFCNKQYIFTPEQIRQLIQ